MKVVERKMLYVYLFTLLVVFVFGGINPILASDVRTYLAFDGLKQKAFPDCVADATVKQELSSKNHPSIESLYKAVEERISYLAVSQDTGNITFNSNHIEQEKEHDCLQAVLTVEMETIERFHANFKDIDTYLRDHAKIYMGINENGNTKSLAECGTDIDSSDMHSIYLDVMNNAYYQDIANWQRTAEHDCLVAVLYLIAQENQGKSDNQSANDVMVNSSELLQSNETATIETTQGTIKIQLYPNAAPNHVKNFQELASKGFYDGIVFHRIVPGFVIQVGDPNTKNNSASRDSWGTGGPGYTINQEFNSIPHEKGILSMARTNDPNSAGSQFFIVLDEWDHLNNNYTVFGKVTEGLEVVDNIANLTTNLMDQPINPELARITEIRLKSSN